MNKKTLSVLMAVFMLFGFVAISPAMASEVGDSGQDRYVKLSVQDTDYYETIANTSVPETIAENYTFDGEITHNLSGSSVNKTENWVNVTINGETYTSGNITLDENETVSYGVEATNLTIEDNVTITVSLQNDDGFSDSVDVRLDIIGDTQYLFGVWMVDMLLSVIPVLVVLAVLMPVIDKIGDLGDEI